MIYEAHIGEDAGNWMNQTVRLFVAQRRHDSSDYLMDNGTWLSVAEGEVATDAGIILPRAAVGAVADAIAEWQGAGSHAATEAKVLREWLDAERARVDAKWGGS